MPRLAAVAGRPLLEVIGLLGRTGPSITSGDWHFGLNRSTASGDWPVGVTLGQTGQSITIGDWPLGARRSVAKRVDPASPPQAGNGPY